MAFAERLLRFTFSGASGFPGAPTGTFLAQGLRAAVDVQAYPDRSGSLAQCKIWGLSLAQMNAYSSSIPNAPGMQAGAILKLNLKIEAGDVGGRLATVVDGNIWRSFIDFSGAPDSCLVVVATSTIFQSANTIASQSQPGPQNVEDLVTSLCAAAGLTARINGSLGVLR
ncbi:MAG: hypothetical protein WAL45_03575, partial [Terracidiphilus sp.]